MGDISKPGRNGFWIACYLGVGVETGNSGTNQHIPGHPLPPTSHRLTGTDPNLEELRSIQNVFKFFNVYSFLRDGERQSVRGEGAEGEGDTGSEAGSRLRAVSTEPEAGLEPTNREIVT